MTESDRPKGSMHGGSDALGSLSRTALGAAASTVIEKMGGKLSMGQALDIIKPKAPPEIGWGMFTNAKPAAPPPKKIVVEEQPVEIVRTTSGNLRPLPVPAGGFSTWGGKTKNDRGVDSIVSVPGDVALHSSTNSAGSHDRNLTWTMMFSPGDRLRYAQLSDIMDSIFARVTFRWNFVAWQDYVRNSPGKGRERNSATSSAGSSRASTPAMPTSLVGSASLASGRRNMAGHKENVRRRRSSLHRLQATKGHEGNDGVEVGINVLVVEPPLAYDYSISANPKYTGSATKRMIGWITLSFHDDNLWHVDFKEMGRSNWDLGAMITVEDRGVLKQALPGEATKPARLVMGLQDTNKSRWKWTFESVFSAQGGQHEVDAFREQLDECLHENEDAMAHEARLLRMQRGVNSGAMSAKRFLSFEMAVLCIQRMWRRLKGKVLRPGMKRVDDHEAHLRHNGAVMMQKVARAFFAKQFLQTRRASRQNECLSAVKLGDIDWVVLMVTRKGVEINFIDSRGRTPLHHAADANQEAVISCLIGLGADIEARDSRGNTPLHLACNKRNTGAARRLAFCGADLEATNEEGWTPITKPNLFLMPLLEGLSRHLLRTEGRLAQLYHEPTFSPRRPAHTRSYRYARPVEQRRLSEVFAGTPNYVRTPRAADHSPRTPRGANPSPRSPWKVDGDAWGTPRTPRTPRAADAVGVLAAVRMPMKHDALTASQVPAACHFPELPHPASRKREYFLQMQIRNPNAQFANLSRRSGMQPMGWTVPMGAMTGRDAPGPVVSRS